MRILKLEIKNLNSLKGEWQIDFTDPAYKNDGLFAIVGPTGAGKTTILDAICLSLYGKTPRLNSITNSSNEIMNRTSTECFAQTTFSTEKGKFRSSFSQRYSRGNRGANLQQPKMEIANAETGEILKTSKSQVPQEVAEITGLTYEQFTRAVLLAQGQFKEFLDAKANDRSELLETITGTQIYSDISERVFIRAKEENAKLKALGQTLADIELLSEEQQKTLEKELEENNSQAKKLKEEIDEVSRQLQWVKDVQKLKKDSEEIEQNIAKNAEEIKEFEPQREQLAQDVKAQKIDADYLVAKQKRDNLEKLDKQIDKDVQAVKKLEEDIKSATKAVEDSEAAFNKTKEALNSQKPTIDKVKSLDTVIEEKKKDFEPEQKKLNQLQSQFALASGKANISSKDLPDDLTADKIDSQISDVLLGISISETRHIIDSFKDLQGAWKKLLDVKKLYRDNSSSIEKFQNELIVYKQRLSEYEKSKQKLVIEQTTAEKLQQSLEKNISLSKLIQSLEEHRKNLVEGSPCPLCGATSHPYGQDNPSVTLTKDEQELKETKKQIRELRETLSGVEKEIAKVETQISHAESTVKDLEQKNDSLQKQSDDVCDNELKCDKDISVKEIENRIRLIAEKTQTTLSRLEKAEKRDALKTPVLIRDAINQQKTELKQKEDALNELLQKRRDLFGDNDPDKIFQQLSNSRDAAATHLNAQRENKTALEAKLTTTKQNLEVRQEEQKSAVKQYGESLAAFNKKLEEQQFSSVDDFLKALLTDEQRERFMKRQREIDEQKTRLEERQRANKENLVKLGEQNLTDKSEEELSQNNISKKTEYELLLLDIGSKNEKLKTNEQRKKQFAEKQTQFEQQQTIAARWSNLNNLIGSEDGKKYRRIVQKLSLEILIDYANEQMNILAPRYLLTLQQSVNDETDSEEKSKKTKSAPAVSGKEDMAIFCIDSWQGGAIRPTANLSGGESFLVSLALALGLSKMSSQNQSMNTLFLDEGFGSLDDETLQTALDAINQFQYSDDANKLVGVISHVDALKERIANKIEVSRTSAGVSVLSGPGVTKGA